MAITTRAELKTAITARIIRTDLTTLYDEFIQFGEIELNSKLRLMQQEIGTPSTVTLSSAATTATLPTNFLEPIALRWSDVEYGPTQRTTEQIADMSTTTTGRPRFFAYSSVFLFERPADQAYTLKSRHFEKWALGSGDSAANWLLTNAPDAYLYASLAAAADQARSLKDSASRWEDRRDKAIARLNRIDARSRKRAPLVMDAGLVSSGGGYDINRS